MHSAIYEGWVQHRRFKPRTHDFRYRLFMMYLDLDELDTVFKGRWLWSTRRLAWARFHRADHLGDSSLPLDQCVRDLVEQQTGHRPAGAIRLLTHLRYWGYGFNPVSFYYCFDTQGLNVETIVAEINNTPWGEQHCYVLQQPFNTDLSSIDSPVSIYSFEKIFHVSPFMPMDIHYDWRFSCPRKTLHVYMSLNPGSGLEGGKLFDATLHLKQRPITALRLAMCLVCFPLMTLKVICAIYWQALLLWLKGIPFYSHPGSIKVSQKLTPTKKED